MKRTITLLLLFFALLSVSAKVKITRIDPTDWYVGMKDPTLQLMVYGEGIRDAEVSTDYPPCAYRLPRAPRLAQLSARLYESRGRSAYARCASSLSSTAAS